MAKTNQPKPTTLGNLAALINRSFTEAQKHTDAQLATLKGELTGIMKDMGDENETRKISDGTSKRAQ
jgi:hypothetical protein